MHIFHSNLRNLKTSLFKKYICILCNTNKFGNKIKNIVEIGGGYGGLATVLYPFIEYESYLLIDLYEANLLSKRYAKKVGYPIVSHVSEEIEIDNLLKQQNQRDQHFHDSV